MNKEPMETTILPEIKRRKRKVSSEHAVIYKILQTVGIISKGM